MILDFRPITADNRQTATKLSVFEDQQNNIETTNECLKEADGLDLWRPVGIYDGETMVGFAMYGLFGNEGGSGRVWLDRFLIDSRYQGKGYGSAALKGLIQLLSREYGKDEIYLSVKDTGIPAVALYKKNGFIFNGEEDEKGEKLMVRHK